MMRQKPVLLEEIKKFLKSAWFNNPAHATQTSHMKHSKTQQNKVHRKTSSLHVEIPPRVHSWFTFRDKLLVYGWQWLCKKKFVPCEMTACFRLCRRSRSLNISLLNVTSCCRSLHIFTRKCHLIWAKSRNFNCLSRFCNQSRAWKCVDVFGNFRDVWWSFSSRTRIWPNVTLWALFMGITMWINFLKLIYFSWFSRKTDAEDARSRSSRCL
jgi:hypothetical protein